MKRVLRGSQREETARFVAFRSHWRFASEFCTPAEGHEKGGVESEVGRFRRNHWVPVPRAGDLEELNRQLLAACQADEARTVAGREQSVGAAMLIERAHLLPLAEEGFDLVEVSFPTVTSLGSVKVKTNAYSVPVKAGATVEARLAAATSRSGTRASASPVTSAATAATRRSWTWSTTWTCWSASPVRSPGASRWSSGGGSGAGPRATTASGRR